MNKLRVLLLCLIFFCNSILADDTDARFAQATAAFQSNDFVKAHSIFKELAEQGHTISEMTLGYFYEKGIGVNKDLYLSKLWYEKAAIKGNSEAQYSLGRLNYFAEGGKKNLFEAFNWYKKAADQGNVTAQSNVGFMYFNGEGTGKDYKQAFNYHEMAAKGGNKISQNALGYMYMNGFDGVKQNLEVAKYWLNLAANQGEQNAKSNLLELNKKLADSKSREDDPPVAGITLSLDEKPKSKSKKKSN